MDGFIGEIRSFPYMYVPQGWLACDGSTLQIRSNQVLFAVIGVNFGGDGQNTFKLPDFRGLIAIGTGSNPAAPDLSPVRLAQTGGANTVALSANNFPPHTHSPGVSGANGNADTPTSALVDSGNGSVAGASATLKRFIAPTAATATNMAPQMIGPAGVNSPQHANNQPTLGLGYFICVEGEFPIRP